MCTMLIWQKNRLLQASLSYKVLDTRLEQIKVLLDKLSYFFYGYLSTLKLSYITRIYWEAEKYAVT